MDMSLFSTLDDGVSQGALRTSENESFCIEDSPEYPESSAVFLYKFSDKPAMTL